MNLAIIGELSLLRDQFGEVLIPGAVLEELPLSAYNDWTLAKGLINVEIGREES